MLNPPRPGRLPRRSPAFSGKGLALSCGCSAPVQPRCSIPEPCGNPRRRHGAVSGVWSTRDTPPAGPRYRSALHPPSFFPPPQKKNKKSQLCVGQRETSGATERARHGRGGGAKARTPPRGVQHPKSPPVRWQRGCASSDLPPGPHPTALSVPAGRARPQLVTPAAAPASTPSLLYPTWSLDTDFFFFFFSMGGSQTVIKSPSLPPAPAPVSSSCCLSKGNPLSSSLSFIIFFFSPPF